MQQNKYDKEPLTAVEAQRLAQEIAFGPIVFQVSRLMLKFGIFQLLADERNDARRNKQSLWAVLLWRTSIVGGIIDYWHRIVA